MNFFPYHCLGAFSHSQVSFAPPDPRLAFLCFLSHRLANCLAPASGKSLEAWSVSPRLTDHPTISFSSLLPLESRLLLRDLVTLFPFSPCPPALSVPLFFYFAQYPRLLSFFTMGKLAREEKKGGEEASSAAPSVQKTSGTTNNEVVLSTSKKFPDPPACFGLGQLTRHNVMQIKQLHMATLPVGYGDQLYEHLPRHSHFSRLGKKEITAPHPACLSLYLLL